jgi:hypothetical protein
MRLFYLLSLTWGLLGGAAASPLQLQNSWDHGFSARVDLLSYQPHTSNAEVVARNLQQSLTARFSPTSLKLEAGEETFRIRTVAWGRQGDEVAITEAQPQPGGCISGGAQDARGDCLRRVVYERVGIQEWWENRPSGLEQGFVIPHPPVGLTPLVVRVAVEGARVEIEAPDSAVFVAGDQRISYTSLLAWDALGNVLPSSIVDVEGGFLLVVDDQHAVGAVTIDPILTSQATWSTTGIIANKLDSGDFNGDGRDDLVVAFETFSGEEEEEGQVLVFMGRGQALAQTAAWSADPANQEDAEYGHSIAVGDLNSDGFDDLVVGAHHLSAPSSFEGRLYAYLGSEAGLSEEPWWTGEVDRARANLGSSLGIGDINGDGWPDVIAGAALETNVVLFYGSAGGLPAMESARVTNSSTNNWFGLSLAVGDVNSDGFDDLAIGAPFEGAQQAGKVFLYHGSDSGIQSTERWSYFTEDALMRLGEELAMGNVNGDAYADLIIGVPNYTTPSFVAEGEIRAFYGSRTGLPTEPSWVDNSANRFDQRLGCSLSLFDLNADGRDDLLAGASGGLDPGAEGRVFLYFAESAGFNEPGPDTILPEDQRTLLGAKVGTGDFNGDGWGDLVAYEEYSPDQPRVHVFITCPNQPETPGNTTDEDCDGIIHCYHDEDQDGYAPADDLTIASEDRDCADPGEVEEALGYDCDDADPSVQGGTEEVEGNEVDEDCDGQLLCFEDGDDDGFAAEGADTIESEDLDCSDAGEAPVVGDCQDDDGSRFPGAEEIQKNGRDEDCDGADDLGGCGCAQGGAPSLALVGWALVLGVRRRSLQHEELKRLRRMPLG